ncbi:MAG TPA: glycosyltransferase family 2 protein [Cytophagaceae bacterium]|jgi:glycosyltransferase involved in cell wall biosynthesis|nr:glycosyltransferase family 2 protein [Cytophagaceae bacterium]
MQSIPLSIVIIAHNEEAIIGKTIEAAKRVSDDIILIDSNSIDRTREIAKEKGVQVYEKAWEGYSAQKNYGNSKAKYNHIFSLDADEVIDNVLAENILKEFRNPSYDCYRINFSNIFLGKRLRFGDWVGESHIRIFDKRKITWNIDSVHESLNIPQDAKRGSLQGKIDHYSHVSLERNLAKANSYTSLHAEQMFMQGKKAGFTKIVLGPILKFVRGYIFKLGFLDGFEGFLVARLSAQYVFIKYSKLKFLIDTAKSGKKSN